MVKSGKNKHSPLIVALLGEEFMTNAWKVLGKITSYI